MSPVLSFVLALTLLQFSSNTSQDIATTVESLSNEHGYNESKPFEKYMAKKTVPTSSLDIVFMNVSQVLQYPSQITITNLKNMAEGLVTLSSSIPLFLSGPS